MEAYLESRPGELFKPLETKVEKVTSPPSELCSRQEPFLASAGQPALNGGAFAKD